VISLQPALSLQPDVVTQLTCEEVHAKRTITNNMNMTTETATLGAYSKIVNNENMIMTECVPETLYAGA